MVTPLQEALNRRDFAEAQRLRDLRTPFVGSANLLDINQKFVEGMESPVFQPYLIYPKMTGGELGQSGKGESVRLPGRDADAYFVWTGEWKLNSQAQERLEQQMARSLGETGMQVLPMKVLESGTALTEWRDDWGPPAQQMGIGNYQQSPNIKPVYIVRGLGAYAGADATPNFESSYMVVGDGVIEALAGYEGPTAYERVMTEFEGRSPDEARYMASWQSQMGTVLHEALHEIAMLPHTGDEAQVQLYATDYGGAHGDEFMRMIDRSIVGTRPDDRLAAMRLVMQESWNYGWGSGGAPGVVPTHPGETPAPAKELVQEAQARSVQGPASTGDEGFGQFAATPPAIPTTVQEGTMTTLRDLIAAVEQMERQGNLSPANADAIIQKERERLGITAPVQSAPLITPGGSMKLSPTSVFDRVPMSTFDEFVTPTSTPGVMPTGSPVPATPSPVPATPARQAPVNLTPPEKGQYDLAVAQGNEEVIAALEDAAEKRATRDSAAVLIAEQQPGFADLPPNLQEYVRMNVGGMKERHREGGLGPPSDEDIARFAKDIIDANTNLPYFGEAQPSMPGSQPGVLPTTPTAGVEMPSATSPEVFQLTPQQAQEAIRAFVARTGNNPTSRDMMTLMPNSSNTVRTAALSEFINTLEAGTSTLQPGMIGSAQQVQVPFQTQVNEMVSDYIEDWHRTRPGQDIDTYRLVEDIAALGNQLGVQGYTGNPVEDYNTAFSGAYNVGRNAFYGTTGGPSTGVTPGATTSVTPGATTGGLGFDLFGDPLAAGYAGQEPLRDIYSRFVSQAPGGNVPTLRSTYEAARPMAQQQFTLQQDPGLGAGLMPQESLYRQFLQGQAGQPLYGTDLQKRIQEISGLISGGPQPGVAPTATEARWTEAYKTPESQLALFGLPFQMAAPYAGARTAYENALQGAFNRYMWQNPTGVTPGGQQFLPWALEQDVMGYEQLYGG